MSPLSSCAQYVNYSRLEFEIQITGGTYKSYASSTMTACLLHFLCLVQMNFTYAVSQSSKAE